MGRTFPFTFEGQCLSIAAVTVNEGWELWVLSGHQKLLCIGRVSVDEVVDAGLRGEDRISTLAEQARAEVSGFRPTLLPDRPLERHVEELRGGCEREARVGCLASNAARPA
jgi:hypothetical protein